MFRTILLPLDGSTFAEHAIPYALDIARRADAALHVVHVYEPDEPWRDSDAITPYRFTQGVVDEPAYEREERSRQLTYLEGVGRIAREHGVPATPTMLDGDVTETIDAYADRIGADLVVMATRGHGGLDRAAVGSVADGLLRRQRTPLLLVRPNRTAPPEPDRAPPLDRILIPLDGSDLASRVLEPATELGRLRKARCTLLSAVPPDGKPGGEPAGPPAADRERTEAGAMRAYLERVADGLRDGWSGVDVQVVEEPDAGRAILRAVERLDIDLIALSTHGRGGLARLVLGSVADAVIRGASVPVLVFRPAVRES